MLFLYITFTQTVFLVLLLTFFRKVHQYETRLASKKSYYLPKAKTNYGKFNIRFSGAKLCNSVPDDLKSESRSCFKKLLKESIGSLVYTAIAIVFVLFCFSLCVCTCIFLYVNIFLRMAFAIFKCLCSLPCYTVIVNLFLLLFFSPEH